MSFGFSPALERLGEMGLTGGHMIGLVSREGKIRKDCHTIDNLSSISQLAETFSLFKPHIHIINQGILVDGTLKFLTHITETKTITHIET